jgi:hypothetical protein
VDYQFSYESGLQVLPGQPQNSIVQTISPGVLFNLGTHWSLDYTPTLTYYSNNQLPNSTGQNISLIGGTTYENWIFGLSQQVSLITAPLIQTGGDTESQSYGTALTASYRFNGNMSVDLSATQNLTYVEQVQNIPIPQPLQNTMEWSTMDYLNYQLWTRLTIGIGAGFTYDSESASPDMTSEQLQARINWRVSNKFTLSCHAGLEDLQYLSGGLSSYISPVFGAAISYKPFDSTSLSLSAERGISPSLLLGENTTSTSLNIALRQRFLKKFSFDLSGGYVTDSYEAAAVVAVPVNRSDDIYTFSARLSWAFWQRARASVFYTYSTDTSSQNGFSFSSNQAGVELAYRF